MKRYERYKESGVEWLGRVPEQWEGIANKYIFIPQKRIVGKKASNYVLLSLTLNGVIKRDMDNPQGKFPAEFDSYQKVCVGDFIFCHFDIEETPRTIGLSSFDGMITGAYTVYEVKNEFDNKFLYYYYLNIDNDKRMRSLYKGLRNTVSKEAFGSLKTFIPPLEEQKAIAYILDQKCAQIDKAVSQKERVIELLNERRQIIIQRAVTRGLDPNVPMKDSGVDWIGEIPEHWEVRKLKFLTSKIGSGVTPRGGSSVYIDNGIPLLRSQNIHFDRVDLSDVACISNFVDSTMSNTRVKEGDVLLNITGGSIGRCYYVKKNFGPANVNQHVCILRPHKFLTQFLYYLMRSNIGQNLIELEQTGGNREGLTFAALKNFAFPVTLLNEQQQIATYLDQVNIKIDKAIALKRQEIEKLKEYKTILIDAAVTGKIKIA